MSGSKDVVIVLDDKAPVFHYGGTLNWTEVSNNVFFDSSVNFAIPAPKAFGTLKATFNGTSIALYGNTPPPTSAQSMQVTIDNKAPFNTTFSIDQAPQSYTQFFQSPELNDGPHTLLLERLDGIAVDYATVTVGQSNVLAGTRIIVDDDDPTILYSGNWIRNEQRFPAFEGQPGGNAYRNSTHQSNGIGDLVAIPFAGTSIRVFGLFSSLSTGTLMASYSLDGGEPATQLYTVAPNSQEVKDGGGVKQNVLLYNKDGLDPKVHSLVINITQNENLTYAFDYVTYTPFFNNLASMPNLQATLPTSTSSTLSSSSSTTSSATSSATSVLVGSHKSSHGGAIAGGVVGGLAALSLLLIGAFLFRRRRLRREQERNEPDMYFSPHIPHAPQTFPPTLSPLMTQVTPVVPAPASYHPSESHIASSSALSLSTSPTSPTASSVPLSANLSTVGSQKKYDPDTRHRRLSNLNPNDEHAGFRYPSFSTIPNEDTSEPQTRSLDEAPAPPAYNDIH